VTADDPAFADYMDIAELPRHVMREMSRFFLDYKKLEEKEVSVEEPLGTRDAQKVIVEAIELYRQEENTLRGWK
jgi:inorganic pyrophosphatase